MSENDDKRKRKGVRNISSSRRQGSSTTSLFFYLRLRPYKRLLPWEVTQIVNYTIHNPRSILSFDILQDETHGRARTREQNGAPLNSAREDLSSTPTTLTGKFSLVLRPSVPTSDSFEIHGLSSLSGVYRVSTGPEYKVVCRGRGGHRHTRTQTNRHVKRAEWQGDCWRERNM